MASTIQLTRKSTHRDLDVIMQLAFQQNFFESSPANPILSFNQRKCKKCVQKICGNANEGEVSKSVIKNKYGGWEGTD